MEVEPESHEEEEDPPSEAEGSGETAEPKLDLLTNGSVPEETESVGTDSGQENAGEGRLLCSGTYSDRTESKAYGSVTHKCEVSCGRPVNCPGRERGPVEGAIPKASGAVVKSHLGGREKSPSGGNYRAYVGKSRPS